MTTFVRCLLIAAVAAGCAQIHDRNSSSFEVEYRVFAPGASSQPYLAGNAEVLGAWRPDGIEFEATGGDVFRAVFHSDSAQIECKLTLGTWSSEALDNDGYLRDNRILTISSDTTIVDTVRAWNDGTATSRVVGQVTGNVEEWGQVEIPGLLPRNAWAWTPEDGRPIETVLFMHDGRNLFNPALANFGVDWGVDEVADALTQDGIVPGLAVVGFDCTDDRFTDYSWGEQGRAYASWLATEGKAMAQGRLNAVDTARFVVCGSSMGGLISLITIQGHPDAFDAAICMSPAFAYKGYDHTDVLVETGVNFLQRPVWIDNGTVGLEAELQPGIDRMTEFLSAHGACTTTRIYEDARHFEADWGERLGEALTWVLAQNCGAHP